MTTHNASSWNDFNDADTQNGFDLIPGMLLPVRMIIKPGGYDDFARLDGRLRHPVLRDRRGVPLCRVRGHRRRLRQAQAVEQHRPVLREGSDLGPDGPQLHPPRSTAHATSIRRTTRRQRPPRAASPGSTISMVWSSSPASTSRRTPRAATATWSSWRRARLPGLRAPHGRTDPHPRRTVGAHGARCRGTGAFPRTGNRCADTRAHGQAGVGELRMASEMLGLQRQARGFGHADTWLRADRIHATTLGLVFCSTPPPGRLPRPVRPLEERARPGNHHSGDRHDRCHRDRARLPQEVPEGPSAQRPRTSVSTSRSATTPSRRHCR